MYLRNLILNWFVMVPIFLLLVLATKALTLFPAKTAMLAFDGYGLAALALFTLALTVVFLSYQIGGRPTQGLSNRDQRLHPCY